MAVEIISNVGPQSQHDSGFIGFSAPPPTQQVKIPDSLQMFLASPKPLEADLPESADFDKEFEFEQGSDSEGDYDMTVYDDD
eukprot:8876212-Karenia_brevis.AAC.1